MFGDTSEGMTHHGMLNEGTKYVTGTLDSDPDCSHEGERRKNC